MNLIAFVIQLSAATFYPLYIAFWNDNNTWDDEVNDLK